MSCELCMKGGEAGSLKRERVLQPHFNTSNIFLFFLHFIFLLYIFQETCQVLQDDTYGRGESHGGTGSGERGQHGKILFVCFPFFLVRSVEQRFLLGQVQWVEKIESPRWPWTRIGWMQTPPPCSKVSSVSFIYLLLSLLFHQQKVTGGTHQD